MLMWLSAIEAVEWRLVHCVIREVGDAGFAEVQTRKLSRYISDKPNQVADYTLWCLWVQGEAALTPSGTPG
jgi:hypothetical protein